MSGAAGNLDANEIPGWDAMRQHGINPGGMAAAGMGTGSARQAGGLNPNLVGGGPVYWAGGMTDPAMSTYLGSMGLNPENVNVSGIFSPTGAGGTLFDPSAGMAPGEFGGVTGGIGTGSQGTGGTSANLGWLSKNLFPGGIPLSSPGSVSPSEGAKDTPFTDPAVTGTSKDDEEKKRHDEFRRFMNFLRVGGGLGSLLGGALAGNGGGSTGDNITGTNAGPGGSPGTGVKPIPAPFYDPNSLKSYFEMNTPNSGALNPLAGMGLLNPINGGTINANQPWMTPQPFLPPNPVFSQSYMSGPSQLPPSTGKTPGLDPQALMKMFGLI